MKEFNEAEAEAEEITRRSIQMNIRVNLVLQAFMINETIQLNISQI